MVPELANVLPSIIRECAANGVRRLWLFGSATGAGPRPFLPDSDIDLLVEFGSAEIGQRGLRHPLFTLPAMLERIAGRRVQLTENVAFENPYFRDRVMATRELIYDAELEQTALGHSSLR